MLTKLLDADDDEPISTEEFLMYDSLSRGATGVNAYLPQILNDDSRSNRETLPLIMSAAGSNNPLIPLLSSSKFSDDEDFLAMATIYERSLHRLPRKHWYHSEAASLPHRGLPGE